MTCPVADLYSPFEPSLKIDCDEKTKAYETCLLSRMIAKTTLEHSFPGLRLRGLPSRSDNTLLARDVT